MRELLSRKKGSRVKVLEVKCGLGYMSRSLNWSTLVILTESNEITPPQPKWEGNRQGGTVGVRKGLCMHVVISVLAD